ncbi:phage tail protein [uncultured Microscilla sp.]|uniref:phage tail protein n=1 Tax=uncultured Microscilla sp. TaxID=432653 RepID=UPI00261107DA|nr:phage tail protein [uncultured Microscilla sp.]
MFGLYQPPPGFHFTLKIVDSPTGSGLTLGGLAKGALAAAAAVAYDNSFMEISGLSGSVQTETIVEGGENEKVYKLPKGKDFSNLVLKRGLVTLTSVLQNWCEEGLTSLDYKFTLKDVTVMLLDNKHSPVKAWKLERAYPVKYEVSGFDAMTGKLMIENIELCYQRITRDKAIEMLVKANQAAQMASMASAALGAVGGVAKTATSAATAAASDVVDTAAVGGAAAAAVGGTDAVEKVIDKADEAKDDIKDAKDDAGDAIDKNT